ncbi:MAG: (2Fe-2S)-binding protein [Synergistaceae bacterium]|jgi:carbon-monoxide dehydrogenase small subunit|nr:(2Fe-2S)-binding protein [Synergistaceae bacterium]
MKTQEVALHINGIRYEISVGRKFGQIPPSETLAETLRGRFSLTGTKIACNEGACGCCTVIIDGSAVASCMVLTVDCDGKRITTIEGLTDPKTGALDPIQQAFIDYYAFQCGYCTPGIIMAGKALLDKNRHPTRAQIQDALSGNFCRCISHYHVIDAIEHIAHEEVSAS